MSSTPIIVEDSVANNMNKSPYILGTSDKMGFR